MSYTHMETQQNTSCGIPVTHFDEAVHKQIRDFKFVPFGLGKRGPLL